MIFRRRNKSTGGDERIIPNPHCPTCKCSPVQAQQLLDERITESWIAWQAAQPKMKAEVRAALEDWTKKRWPA